MAEKKKKIYFDIVNSVKGGSGKSTVSLLLATYFSSKQENAYIIDLDLRGTSWEANYDGLFCPPGESQPREISPWEQLNKKEFPYINNLLWDFEQFDHEGIWADLHISTIDPSRKQTVHICLNKTDNGHIVDQVEEDLFENTVFQIIRGVINKLLESENKDTIHILFDMPPSYERHAERVVEHIILSENSRLVKFLNDKDDIEYSVTFYMISAVSPAHFAQNAHYIKHFFQKQSYSGRAFELANTKQLCVRSIINDVSGVVSETLITQKHAKDQANKWIQKVRAEFDWYDGKEELFQDAAFLQHISTSFFNSMLSSFNIVEKNDCELLCPEGIYNDIDNIFSLKLDDSKEQS